MCDRAWGEAMSLSRSEATRLAVDLQTRMRSARQDGNESACASGDGRTRALGWAPQRPPTPRASAAGARASVVPGLLVWPSSRSSFSSQPPPQPSLCKCAKAQQQASGQNKAWLRTFKLPDRVLKLFRLLRVDRRPRGLALRLDPLRLAERVFPCCLQLRRQLNRTLLGNLERLVQA